MWNFWVSFLLSIKKRIWQPISNLNCLKWFLNKVTSINANYFSQHHFSAGVLFCTPGYLVLVGPSTFCRSFYQTIGRKSPSWSTAWKGAKCCYIPCAASVGRMARLLWSGGVRQFTCTSFLLLTLFKTQPNICQYPVRGFISLSKAFPNKPDLPNKLIPWLTQSNQSSSKQVLIQKICIQLSLVLCKDYVPVSVRKAKIM